MKAKHPEITPMGFGISLIVGLVTMAALYCAIRMGIPWIREMLLVQPIIAWFISASVLIFIPMIVITLILVRLEQNQFTLKSFLSRVRFKTLKSEDWLWIGLGVVLTIILTGFVSFLVKVSFPTLSSQPSLLGMTRVNSENWWILLAWLPMFFLNIVGEELFWRGYIFPKQMKAFGKKTWFYNGVIWLIFHIPFGLNLIFMILPTIFLTTFGFQKTNNIKVSMAINGIINGIGFLAVALGYI